MDTHWELECGFQTKMYFVFNIEVTERKYLKLNYSLMVLLTLQSLSY